jgi:tripartite-type tricarboxylate transporter receptor subunit TctC
MINGIKVSTVADVSRCRYSLSDPQETHMTQMNRRHAALALASLATTSPAAWAQAGNYPNKPMTYVLPFVAGGESDIAARFQQQALQKLAKQEMVIQYKAGAGGGLAWSQLNTMPGDGYHVMGINLPHVFLQPLEGNVQYKGTDLTPVYYFHYTPDALLVSIDSPYKTLADFIAAAKRAPGKLNIGGSATLSANHLATERFGSLSGTKSQYVPFKGTGELITSILGRHIDAGMSYTTLYMGQKTKLRALAVAMEKRHPSLPDVPTFKELGIDMVGGAYRGVAVPKSTPESIREQVSALFGRLNNEPELRRRMIEGGFEPIDVPYGAMAKFQRDRSLEYLDAAKLLGLLR